MDISILFVVKAIVSIVFLMTAVPKLSGQAPAKKMFRTLGAEPHGRILAGFMELAAVLLLWIPGMMWLGALLGILTMIGAIGAHVTKLGIHGMFLLALAMLAGNAWMFFSTNPWGIGAQIAGTTSTQANDDAGPSAPGIKEMIKERNGVTSGDEE